MEVVPRLGLGDILCLKLRALSVYGNAVTSICLNDDKLRKYRLEPERAIEFIDWLVRRLFPGIAIRHIMDEDDIAHCTLNGALTVGKIDPTILFDQPIVSFLPQELRGQRYIVFHTKVRALNASKRFVYFQRFLREYKTNTLIVLLGERVIEQNIEAKLFNVTSLYPELIRYLPAKNNVIDLTEKMLYSGNSTNKGFLRDIAIINGADCNICIGIGGNMCISKCFSQRLVCWPGETKNDTVKAFKKISGDNDKFFSSISLFLSYLRTL